MIMITMMMMMMMMMMMIIKGNVINVFVPDQSIKMVALTRISLLTCVLCGVIPRIFCQGKGWYFVIFSTSL